ncbi:gustatory receptor for bitter taste 66a [Halyomorpha halys]|uniref:gustatory receptor for bitter taste 66a n=1 Tax=Halyomorpha halys TaxID=286706 RepID=UPI0006D524B9|nr:gustatory receptor for bitter taste 66a-like [Halyomorpha halys]
MVHSLDTLQIIFHKMDGEMKKIPIQKKNLLEIFCVPILCGILFCTLGNTATFASGIIMIVFLLGTSLCCGQFNAFVDTVTEFFLSSVKLLVRMRHENSFKKLMIVEKLADAVRHLVCTSTKMNTVYSQPLLITVSHCYCSVMTHLYFVYLNSCSADYSRIRLVYGDSIIVVYNVFLVWRMLRSTGMAYHKSKEFNTLLYQLMIEDKTNQFIHNDKLRLHISMKREVVFTACGFFNLDYTLVHSMIASATTYLVILIQFGQPVNMAQDLRPHVVFTNSTTPLPLSFTTPL